MSTPDGFQHYSRIMALFDELIEECEAVDGEALSAQQRHDIAYYYEEHLRRAIKVLGAEKLKSSQRQRGTQPIVVGRKNWRQ